MNNEKNICREDTSDIRNQEKYAKRVSALVKRASSDKGRELYVHVSTFGCQQNEADSERLLGTALSLGYKKAECIEKADLVIFNTCAVREHAELRALSKTGQLKHLKEKNKDMLIGLWGCMVSREERVDEIKHKYPYVDFVGGTSMLHRLPEILCDVMETNRRRYYVDSSASPMVEGVPVSRESDIKAWVSIMYGCDNFCTYCIVPHVRGRERSRKKSDILCEVKELVNKGYKEITLLGQNVNSYGKNLDGEDKCTFAQLLSEICAIDGDFTVRFMTSHPKDVSDELIKVIAENPKVERHFHLPIQSGSDEILKRMNRRYTREGYLETVRKLRSAVPDIALTTDIIVGFPNETDEDFEKTLEVVKQVKYDGVYSFIYSPRPGTPAAEMPDETEYEAKTERFSRLMSLHRENILSINDGYVGKTIRVLCESNKDEKGFCTGRNSEFKLVRFTSDKDDIYGKYVNVEITSAGESQVFGHLV